MKISPINFSITKPNFKGEFCYNYNESTLKQNPLWNTNSSSEETLGSYHANKTNLAYFASPMEPISDSIKEKADFIVYDNEPTYPDINEVRENYLGTLRKNFKNFFEDVRLYFYRREMGGFANKQDAQYRQWQAAECTRMYDAAGDLRYKKETAENTIKNLELDKYKKSTDLNISERELAAQEQMQERIDKHIETLRKLEQPYQELGTILDEEGIKNEQEMYETSSKRKGPEPVDEEYLEELKNTAYYWEGYSECPDDTPYSASDYENTTLTYSDINRARDNGFKLSEANPEIKKQHEKLVETIGVFTMISTICTTNITKIKAHIESLKNSIANTDRQIASQTTFIEDCKAKLTPLFNELKNFYTKHGLKGLKK